MAQPGPSRQKRLGVLSPTPEHKLSWCSSFSESSILLENPGAGEFESFHTQQQQKKMNPAKGAEAQRQDHIGHEMLDSQKNVSQALNQRGCSLKRGPDLTGALKLSWGLLILSCVLGGSKASKKSPAKNKVFAQALPSRPAPPRPGPAHLPRSVYPGPISPQPRPEQRSKHVHSPLLSLHSGDFSLKERGKMVSFW